MRCARSPARAAVNVFVFVIVCVNVNVAVAVIDPEPDRPAEPEPEPESDGPPQPPALLCAPGASSWRHPLSRPPHARRRTARRAVCAGRAAD